MGLAVAADRAGVVDVTDDADVMNAEAATDDADDFDSANAAYKADEAAYCRFAGSLP